MKVLNFTAIKKKDIKIYSVGGKEIPGGINVSTIVIYLACLILINLFIGLPIHKIFGVSYTGFTQGNYFGFFMFALPGVATYFINSIKIHNMNIVLFVFNCLQSKIIKGSYDINLKKNTGIGKRKEKIMLEELL